MVFIMASLNVLNEFGRFNIQKIFLHHVFPFLPEHLVPKVDSFFMKICLHLWLGLQLHVVLNEMMIAT